MLLLLHKQILQQRAAAVEVAAAETVNIRRAGLKDATCRNIEGVAYQMSDSDDSLSGGDERSWAQMCFRTDEARHLSHRARRERDERIERVLHSLRRVPGISSSRGSGDPVREVVERLSCHHDEQRQADHGDRRPLEMLRAFASCGCGFLETLKCACLLNRKVVVKAVLQLCCRVASTQTQQQFIEACNVPKGCPSCLWVCFAVCLEQHPDLSEEVASVLERLICDSRREVVKLIMAPMRLIRRAWSRSHDSSNPELDYPFMGNCLDFKPSYSFDGYTGDCLHLDPSSDAEFSLLGVDSSRMFFGPDSKSLSHKLGNIMLSEALKKRLMSLNDECAYRNVVDQVLSYLSDEREWTEGQGLAADSLPPRDRAAALARARQLDADRAEAAAAEQARRDAAKAESNRRRLEAVAAEQARQLAESNRRRAEADAAEQARLDSKHASYIARQERREAWAKLTDAERLNLGEERQRHKKEKLAKAVAEKAKGFLLSHGQEGCYNWKRMKKARFTAAELNAVGANLPTLVAAGYGARELKSMGFICSQLLEADPDLKMMKNEGVSAAELNSWGFDLPALRAAGYSARELHGSCKFPLSMLVEAGCDFKMMTDEGIRAAQLQVLGADLPALLGLGYNVTELQRLGFTLLQWQEAGYDLKRMKKEGITAAYLSSRFGADLRTLAAAGFNLTELKGVGIQLSQLMQQVTHPVHALAARCNRRRLGHYISLHRTAAVPAWHALEISLSFSQQRTLATRGSAFCLMLVKRLMCVETECAVRFRSPLQHEVSVLSRLVVAGTGSPFLRRAQDAMKVPQFMAVGFDFKMLTASFSVQELIDAGFTLSHWQRAGYDLKQMNAISFHGCYSIDELAAAGFDVADIIVSRTCCPATHIQNPNTKSSFCTSYSPSKFLR